MLNEHVPEASANEFSACTNISSYPNNISHKRKDRFDTHLIPEIDQRRSTGDGVDQSGGEPQGRQRVPNKWR